MSAREDKDCGLNLEKRLAITLQKYRSEEFPETSKECAVTMIAGCVYSYSQRKHVFL